MDIAVVAKRSGVPASALRFYEEKGLIVSNGRQGLRRTYDPSVLERLALIALGRAAGFALDEIALMFAADGRPRIDRQKLAQKADQLDRTIKELSAMRDGLRHAVACRAPSHMECPTFRRLLRAAQTGALGGRPSRTLRNQIEPRVAKPAAKARRSGDSRGGAVNRAGNRKPT